MSPNILLGPGSVLLAEAHVPHRERRHLLPHGHGTALGKLYTYIHLKMGWVGLKSALQCHVPQMSKQFRWIQQGPCHSHGTCRNPPLGNHFPLKELRHCSELPGGRGREGSLDLSCCASGRARSSASLGLSPLEMRRRRGLQRWRKNSVWRLRLKVRHIYPDCAGSGQEACQGHPHSKYLPLSSAKSDTILL